jgi:hypothetical protein
VGATRATPIRLNPTTVPSEEDAKPVDEVDDNAEPVPKAKRFPFRFGVAGGLRASTRIVTE